MKIQRFIQTYLDCIGIEGYTIQMHDTESNTIVTIEIPKTNVRLIGILKGKNGRNLLLLKQLSRVIGLSEHIEPFIIIKLI